MASKNGKILWVNKKALEVLDAWKKEGQSYSGAIIEKERGAF